MTQLPEPPETLDLPQQERSVYQRTVSENEELAQLWLGGVSLLFRAFDPLDGRRMRERERDLVLHTLLIHATNTQLAGFKLAATGYYAQALALVRICVEHWLAFWYVKNFSDEAPRFLRRGTKRPPDTNHMEQALAAKHGEDATVGLKAWIKRLHSLAHVDPTGVNLTFDPAPGGISLHLGPHYDQEMFLAATQEFVTVLPALQEAAEVLCRLVGAMPPAPDIWRRYDDRAQALLTALIGTTSQPVSETPTQDASD
jgi:hypothetical protein